MLKIAMVDDKVSCVENTKLLLNRFFHWDSSQYRLTCFSDGLDLINTYTCNFDVILLDIEMKHLDGMETAKKIREVDREVILIFMTKMAQFAACGYDVDAIGFLVKPIDYYSFEMKMKKVLSILEQRKSVNLLITDNYEKRIISSKDIYYIEVISHSIVIHTTYGEFKHWCSLKECKQKLLKAHFENTSRFFLVNLEDVRTVKEKSVSVGNIDIPLSRSKKKSFMTALTKFYGG